jgi:acetyltransferase-like isoleucine patch superfamily enzyme
MFHNKFFTSICEKLKVKLHCFLRRHLEFVVNDIRMNSFLCFGPKERLIIHPTAVIQNAFFNTISGKITICELALIAHNVSILTGSHNVYSKNEKRHPPMPAINDICVMRGAWIASNAVIIGPCVIGENSVVAAGSVVIHDVPPNTMVAGNPATVKKDL